MVRRFAGSYAAAAAVMLGAVVGRWRSGAVPVEHLWRPLLVAAGLSVLVAAVACLFGRHAEVLAAAVAGFVVVPSELWFGAAAVVAVIVVWLGIRGRVVSMRRPVIVAAVIFFASGVATAIPLVRIHSVAQPALVDDPVFLILLDAYPRADTLATIGVDISGFITQLEERGFDHYPDAYSHHGYTNRTLSLMLAGHMTDDTYPTFNEKRELRESWTLPPGFVTVAPPVGHVVIPGTVDIGAGGVTDFEVILFQESALAYLPGSEQLVMGWWRDHIDADMRALEETEWPRVFAHFMVPHVPHLYMEDGSPAPLPKWPGPYMVPRPTTSQGLPGTIDWLNVRIVEIVDSILAKHPDATIVLFSDHGNRFTDLEDDHKAFLAARTPGRPGLFVDDPAVGNIVSGVIQASLTIGP